MRISTAIVLSLMCTPAWSAEEQASFLINLRAAAASCSITSSSEATSAFLVGRDSGTNSKKYKLAIEKAYQRSKACVDEGKPKMKPFLRAEVEAHPALRDVTLDTYAKWITYMDWLSTPQEWAADSREKDAFQQAANRLQAEIDSQ